MVALGVSLGLLIGVRERRLWNSLPTHCPRCQKEAREYAYYCSYCGQRLRLVEKEELEVAAEELEEKVEELAHCPNVKRILVLDDMGTFDTEVLVSEEGIRKRRFNILPPTGITSQHMPKRYTVIVEITVPEKTKRKGLEKGGVHKE
jgi:hypothetical protein